MALDASCPSKPSIPELLSKSKSPISEISGGTRSLIPKILREDDQEPPLAKLPNELKDIIYSHLESQVDHDCFEDVLKGLFGLVRARKGLYYGYYQYLIRLDAHITRKRNQTRHDLQSQGHRMPEGIWNTTFPHGHDLYDEVNRTSVFWGSRFDGDRSSLSALTWAIWNGQKKLFAEVLHYTPDICEPMHVTLAIEQGRHDLALSLLQEQGVRDRISALNKDLKFRDPVSPNAAVSRSPWHPIFECAKKGHVELTLQLLKDFDLPVDLYIHPDEMSLLHFACLFGHLELAQALLERGANPKGRSREGHISTSASLPHKYGGKTPLMCALLAQHEPIIQELLSRCPDECGSAENLCCAALSGRQDLVDKFLSAGAEVNPQQERVYGTLCINPLYHAIKGGHLAIVKQLLDLGARQSLQDPMDSSCNSVDAMRVIAHHGRNKDSAGIAKLLIDARSQAETCFTISTNDDRTMLRAIEVGNVDLVKVLLPRCPGARGISIGYSGSPEMVKFLLWSGWDVNRKDKHGCTPLWLAAERLHRDSRHNGGILQDLLELWSPSVEQADEEAELLERQETFQAILSRTRDIDAFSSIGSGLDIGSETALHVCCGMGTRTGSTAEHEMKAAVVQLLLDHGADVTITDDGGRTPLHRHCSSNAALVAVTEKLLHAGASVHATPRNTGRTPLHFLCENPSSLHPARVTCVKLLLQHGADPSHQESQQSMFNPEGRRLALHIPQEATTDELRAFIDVGVDLESDDYRGSPHLVSLAYMHGPLAQAAMLLEANPRVLDMPNSDGMTPLMAAAQTGNLKMVKFLVERGACVNVGDKSSWKVQIRALDFAESQWFGGYNEEQRTGVALYARRVKLREFLRSHGARTAREICDEWYTIYHSKVSSGEEALSEYNRLHPTGSMSSV